MSWVMSLLYAQIWCAFIPLARTPYVLYIYEMSYMSSIYMSIYKVCICIRKVYTSHYFSYTNTYFLYIYKVCICIRKVMRCHIYVQRVVRSMTCLLSSESFLYIYICIYIRIGVYIYVSIYV